jgi:transaldolase
MDKEVDPKIIEELRAKFPDFRKAYDADGMTPEEFDTYGAVLKTLKGFYAGYDELVTIIRNFIVS